MDEVEPFDFFYRKEVIFRFKGEKGCLCRAKVWNYFFESIALH